MKKVLVFLLAALFGWDSLGQTSVADGDWSDGATWGGTAPGFTGLNNPVIDSYVIANSGLTFASANGKSLVINDTLIVYGDLLFDANRNDAGITIGANNVLIIFGSLEMGKNNAGINLAAGSVLVVSGNITASGNNGEITGDGSYYTNGLTGGMTNNSSNPQGTSDDLSDNGYTSIEEFVDGGGDIPLPVALLYFSVENKNGINVKWATATENNNDYFSVERSEDGEYFYEIGQVDGNGNSKTQIDYSFADKFAFAPVEYYRLNQVDFDGQSERFQARRIETSTDGSKQEIIIPSVISNGKIPIRSNRPFQIRELTMHSLAGAEVRNIKVDPIQQEVLKFEIDVGALSEGIYLLKFHSAEGSLFTKRLLIKVQ